mgnify:CR=1 FL=1
MWYVYVLRCKDGTLYVGYTRNLRKRIQEHKNGSVKYTKTRLPVKVIWIGVFLSKKKAVLFEKYLKSGSGKAFLKKRLI